MAYREVLVTICCILHAWASPSSLTTSVNFGRKSTVPNSLTFNELFFETTVGQDKKRGVLNANVDRVNFGITSFSGEDNRKCVELPPYYVQEYEAYSVYEIPGNSINVQGDFDKVRAEYTFNVAGTSTLPKLTLTKVARFTSAKNVAIVGPEDKLYEWDSGVGRVTIAKATYDNTSAILNFQVTQAKSEMSRTFFRILGPTIKDSSNDLRGIVYKYDTVSSEDMGEVVVEVSEIVEGQLGFVQKLQQLEKTTELNSMFEGDKKYKVAAFQCSEFSSIVVTIGKIFRFEE
ncbi:hypothetical protein Ciccas_013878 [Cichlidogyrus casuarinus]|uniref:Uncharacterized protein n=1 Tax=Cichlidogyrus casuarinus TaxID=1844966 RepID=A0ABD2PJI5_9PLAT